jgi:NADH pyrophosphatase NudC (nudix superfamily)
LREDPDWFAAALADPESRVIPVWDSRSLVTDGPAPQAAYLQLTQLSERERANSGLILLGRFGTRSLFAYEVEGVEAPPAVAGTHFEDLRMVAALLSAEEAGPPLPGSSNQATWR